MEQDACLRIAPMHDIADFSPSPLRSEKLVGAIQKRRIYVQVMVGGRGRAKAADQRFYFIWLHRLDPIGHG
jgi:hypothetical protein